MGQIPVPFPTFSLHVTRHLLDTRPDHLNAETGSFAFYDEAGNGYYSARPDNTLLSLSGVNHVSCGTLTIATDPRLNFTFTVNGDNPPQDYWDIRLHENIRLVAVPLSGIPVQQLAEVVHKVCHFRLHNMRWHNAMMLLHGLMSHCHLLIVLDSPRHDGAIYHFDSPETLLDSAQAQTAFALFRQLP